MKKLCVLLLCCVFAALIIAPSVSADASVTLTQYFGVLTVAYEYNAVGGTTSIQIISPSVSDAAKGRLDPERMAAKAVCNGNEVSANPFSEEIDGQKEILSSAVACSSLPEAIAVTMTDTDGNSETIFLIGSESDFKPAAPEPEIPPSPAPWINTEEFAIQTDAGERKLWLLEVYRTGDATEVVLYGKYENLDFDGDTPIKPFDIEVLCGNRLVKSGKLRYDFYSGSFIFTVDCVETANEIVLTYTKDGAQQRKVIYNREEAGFGFDPGGIESDAITEDEPVSYGGDLDYVLAHVDPAYKDALEALRSGDPIANGTQSETVRTVQAIFNEFGFKLPLTGGFYNQSLASLQTIEETFGMEKTNSLDAATLERILINLLYYRAAKNETSEEEAFPNTPDFDELERNLNLGTEAGNHLYLKACAYQMAGAYYKAYQTFEESGSDDYEQRMDACAQDWPATGQIDRDPNFYGTNTSLTFRIGKDADTAVIIKILRKGVTVSTLFLGRGDTVTAYLAGDTQYQLKLGMGEKWYGIKDTFGDDGYYEVMTYEDGTDTVFLEAGGIYTLSINTTVTTGGDPVDSERVPYSDF